MPKSPPVLAQTEAIGRYQVLRRLARGGMAEVLLARVTGLEGFEKLVVIKKILPELTQSREFVDMFLDEARVLAQLQHTNIAQVYDIGSIGGAYFMSMEFLHGQDLRTLIKSIFRRGERLPVEHALFIAASVCHGLHYAHEKVGLDGQHLGIVHRDVSPHNVFVTYDGAVKLLDFGIAKTARRASHTRAGLLKGKIRYMAPEQCRSDADLDRRADVYSVGVLMWEMLAGERLHGGGTDFEIMKAICEDDAPLPSTVRPCDPDVERMVVKALARDPVARYQTAQQLLEEIEELARTRRLKLSAHDLALYVRGIFAQQIATWESARSEGKSLGEHMLDVTRADRYLGASEPAPDRPPLPPPGQGGTPADADAPTAPGFVGRLGGRAHARRGGAGTRLGRAGAGATLLAAMVAGGSLYAVRGRGPAPDARPEKAISATRPTAAIVPRVNAPDVVAAEPSAIAPADAPKLGVEVDPAGASPGAKLPAAQPARDPAHAATGGVAKAKRRRTTRAVQTATPAAEPRPGEDADSLDVE